MGDVEVCEEDGDTHHDVTCTEVDEEVVDRLVERFVSKDEDVIGKVKENDGWEDDQVEDRSL